LPDQDYLVIRKLEGAPDGTIEQWNLEVGREAPEAAKFFVQQTEAAEKVWIPAAPLPAAAPTSAILPNMLWCCSGGSPSESGPGKLQS
jgi:hypothetical protein